MADPEITLPPRQPNTPRVWLPKLGRWLIVNWRYVITAIISFILGAVIF